MLNMQQAHQKVLSLIKMIRAQLSFDIYWVYFK